MSTLKIYQQEEIHYWLVKREGEEKLGEHISFIDDLTELKNIEARFILLGIPESIGVLKNHGIEGTHTAWEKFLSAFLNIQHNQFFNGKDICLLGKIETDDKDSVHNLDETVSQVIQEIISCKKFPIVIGGGHNNCYGMIKGSSLALEDKINVINLDPHADLRELEGRHSGNGFSYALNDGFLEKYAMIGLHKAYNNQMMIDRINQEENLQAIWWEEIFVEEKMNFDSAIEESLAFINQYKFGIELDMDAIENTLSSAITPLGVSSREAMKYIYKSALQPNSIYLHLPEACYERSDGLKQASIGKLLSYLVQSFITAKNNWEP